MTSNIYLPHTTYEESLEWHRHMHKLKHLLKHIYKLNYPYYDFLSGNPNITWECVQNHPDEQWDYKNLSRNSNIT